MHIRNLINLMESRQRLEAKQKIRSSRKRQIREINQTSTRAVVDSKSRELGRRQLIKKEGEEESNELYGLTWLQGLQHS